MANKPPASFVPDSFIPDEGGVPASFQPDAVAPSPVLAALEPFQRAAAAGARFGEAGARVTGEALSTRLPLLADVKESIAGGFEDVAERAGKAGIPGPMTAAALLPGAVATELIPGTMGEAAAIPVFGMVGKAVAGAKAARMAVAKPHVVTPQGYKLVMEIGPQNDPLVVARDSAGKKIGNLDISGHYTEAVEGYGVRAKDAKVLQGDVFVDEAHRRKGLASAMYDFAEKTLGKKFKPSGVRTEAGDAFWAARAPSVPTLPDLIGELEKVKKMVSQAKSEGIRNPKAIMTGTERELYDQFRHQIHESINHNVGLPWLAGEDAAAEMGKKYALPWATGSTPFKAPPGAARVNASQVDLAHSVINLERLKDESAVEIIAGLSQERSFVLAIEAQKRGIIQLARSHVAGERLGLGAEDFAKLKPGQLPKPVSGRATLDAQVAAASAVQNKAAADLFEVAQLHASGKATVESLAERIAINYEAIVGAQGVISETGRALGAVRLSPADRVALKLSKVMLRESLMEDPARMSAFLKQVAELPTDAIAQRILATKRLFQPENSVYAMIREGRAALLLTNPVTFVRNAAGNTMAAMSNLVERPLAGAVDFMAAKLTGTPQQRLIGEGAANAYGAWQGIKSGLRDAVEVLLNETSLKGLGSEFATRAPAIPGVVGKVIRTPFRVLSATDTLFKNLISQGEMHRLAYRQAAKEGLSGVARARRVQELVANPAEEMVDGAIAAGKEFTFQESPKDFAFIEKWLNSDNPVSVAAKFMVPFFRTPVNIAGFVLERTPFFAELTRRGLIRQAFMEEGLTRGQVADYIARNVVGTAAMSSAYLALRSHEGLLTGPGPRNKAERDTLYATGWRPNSIKIGGLYIPHQGFQPLSSYLGVVAETAQFMRENPESGKPARVGAALAAGVKNFIDQPFLQGLKSVMDALDEPEGRRTASALHRAGASVIPTGVSAVARSKDPTVRDPETFMESLMAATPYLSQRVRPRLTKWGEPVMRTSFFFGLADRPRDPTDDPVEAELRALGVPMAVGFPANHVGRRLLTKDEFNDYLTQTGKAIRHDMELIVQDGGYREAPPIARRQVIQQIISRHRDEVIDTYRARAELRALGIPVRLSEVELNTLGKQIIKTPDYEYMRDPDRRKAVREWVHDLEESRRPR